MRPTGRSRDCKHNDTQGWGHHDKRCLAATGGAKDRAAGGPVAYFRISIASLRRFTSITAMQTRYANARCKNAAIWPLVTVFAGQNSLLTGGLQPLVIPATASLAISTSSTNRSSSVKSLPPPFSQTQRRTRNAAIWPLLTAFPAQN